MIDWTIKFECESEHDKIYRRINNIVVVYVRRELHRINKKVDEVINQLLK